MATTLVREMSQGLVHLFYPRLCEGCGKPLLKGEQVLCISCGLQLPETGYHDIEDNETALRFAGRVPFYHATSLAWFITDGLLQHLIHGLKYKGKKETGIYLGSRLGIRLKETDWGKGIDVIVPVPLHPAKQAKRGYNQSMLIAQGIGKTMGIPASDKLLVRTRDTQTQTKKTRAERVTNMEGAFKTGNRETLKNKHILLCDDVLTTGATLESCILALLNEESIKISIATIGIAVS
jgi:ComF family protein